eukprot:2177452-Pyramimonas_sp.AAC.2
MEKERLVHLDVVRKQSQLATSNERCEAYVDLCTTLLQQHVSYSKWDILAAISRTSLCMICGCIVVA